VEVALDEPREDDEVIDYNGIKVIANREQSKDLGLVEIDYRDTWLRQELYARNIVEPNLS
jgi:Fe-S cluster assembly iron-binding protein IscA